MGETSGYETATVEISHKITITGKGSSKDEAVMLILYLFNKQNIKVAEVQTDETGNVYDMQVPIVRSPEPCKPIGIGFDEPYNLVQVHGDGSGSDDQRLACWLRAGVAGCDGDVEPVQADLVTSDFQLLLGLATVFAKE